MANENSAESEFKLVDLTAAVLPVTHFIFAKASDVILSGNGNENILRNSM
jgi:hypothetical protein